MINHKSNSTLPSIQAKKDASTSHSNNNNNNNNETRNDSSTVASVKISHEAENQNMPESCWICGKVGHLTRYCQSTPPTILFLAQEMKQVQQKKATDKPRDEKGRVLYTSDESSDDELNYLTMNCDSDDDVKKMKNSLDLDHDIKLLSDDDDDDKDEPLKYKMENNVNLDHDIKLLSVDDDEKDESLKYKMENSVNLDHDIKLLSDDDNDEKEELKIALKYKAYFSHINVEFGQRYAVSRSDEDIASSLWPLFFVQIQSTECQQILEAHLDSLIANTPLANAEMVIGALCVAYCERFDAKFRAVITAICENLVEVFYIDYGNYEWVEHNTLWSIADQDQTTITHPGMAIPCILNVYEEEEGIASCLSRNDIIKMKLAVSCNQWGFYLNFRKQRPDGICVVELETEERID